MVFKHRKNWFFQNINDKLQKQKMNLQRRQFLKNTAIGTTGITIFSPFSFNSCNAQTTGNFPFYEFSKLYDFGIYIPKDQGGKFIQEEILGTEDDAVIVEKIKDGILEKIYGEPLNWGSLEKTELEKSVWLNRFYYLPSFARLYYLNKDKNALDFMMRFIRKWIAENPKDAEVKTSKYNWYDMQVAWRVIHLSWCYFLGRNGLSAEDKTLITDSLEEHASLLLSHFGEQKLNEFNHQAHGALAMLYLGVLFPLLNDSAKLTETAMRILEHHIKYAFYKDGGNVEQMFGYYPFETHIFRDTFLLCKSNGIQPSAGIEELLKKMFNYLVNTAQPDGTMPQINDSFPMPVAATIATLKEVIGNKEISDLPSSQYFQETQIGVLRSNDKDKNWYILVNPASVIGSHAHAGRLSFTLWFNQNPVFIDSGCCNYDDHKLVEWYRTTRAHNTVVIDDISDEETSSEKQWAAKRQTENRITEWLEDTNFTFCKMVSPETEKTNGSVHWERIIALVNNSYAIIYDHFKSTEQHNYELLFHTPPLKVEANSENKSLLIKSETLMALVPAKSDIYEKVIITENDTTVKGKNTLSPVINYHAKGAELHSVFLVAPVKESATEIQVKQELTDNGITLKIELDSGRKDTIHIPKTKPGLIVESEV